MISGIVTDRHAIVALTFLLRNDSSIPIEFVIDTGFTGDLCLPPEAVSLMGLTFRHDTPANWADNSELNKGDADRRGDLTIFDTYLLSEPEECEGRVLLIPFS